MKYRALPIKNWVISKVSPIGWSMVIARSMPEILEYNPEFSAYYINKRTKWSETELKVVRIYLKKMYNMHIPEEVINPGANLPVDYMDLVRIDFLKTSRLADSLKARIKSIYNLMSI
ncbi:hypothetical protein [Marinoscillum sp. MHG1-6]|uniref:hypothetical protein n=1 Tax=Marinoscillum sp. MHG1-6 TaxID=2959627 RepID=UPI0021587EBC|nr:hypothetical protein [Marinoscillum sp. MHG1-6]